MNYNTACKNLDISVDNEIDINMIKKQYRLNALLYHPDKNQSPDASDRFREIQESYEYLLNYYKNEVDTDDFSEYEYGEYEKNIDKTTYRWILFSFLKNMLQSDSKNKLFCVILQRVVSSCELTALEILQKLDKIILIKIYNILKMYEDVFHFTKEFVVKIEALVASKLKNDECIILNPTIDDLFENNLYKLSINDFTYIIPLWHDELIYDNSGNDIIVKCFPILPENVCIDNNNDVHIIVTFNLQDLWNKPPFELTLGCNKRIQLNPKLLKITPEQTVLYAKQGISKINTESVYDVSKQSDIYLHVKLVNIIT